MYCIREKRRDPIHFSKTTNKHIKGDGTRRRSERLNIQTTKVMDRVERANIEKIRSTMNHEGVDEKQGSTENWAK